MLKEYAVVLNGIDTDFMIRILNKFRLSAIVVEHESDLNCFQNRQEMTHEAVAV